jgi:hypothetical protein
MSIFLLNPSQLTNPVIPINTFRSVTLTLSGPTFKVYMLESNKFVSFPSFWSGKG